MRIILIFRERMERDNNNFHRGNCVAIIKENVERSRYTEHDSEAIRGNNSVQELVGKQISSRFVEHNNNVLSAYGSHFSLMAVDTLPHRTMQMKRNDR